MIQEYLLLKNDELKAIKEYKPDGVSLRSFSANKGKCRYIQFFVEGDNEEAAKTLSKLDDTIREKFHLTILESGCAVYFNKRLYPLINNFEIKLRKLLYLTSAINKKGKTNKNIANLEKQDFGWIFSMLFIDNNFMSKVKEHIKNLNQEHFVKSDILSFVESIEEKTVWDELLGVKTVPTLRNRFNDIRVYRNDVMHSHLINWERYREIQELYDSVNNELDEALHDIEIIESKAPSKPDFNNALEQALKQQDEWKQKLEEIMKPGLAEMQSICHLIATNSAISGYSDQAAAICKTLATSTAFADYQKYANEKSKVFATNAELVKLLSDIKVAIPPALQKMQEFSSLIPKAEIPSEMLKLQNTLTALNMFKENKALQETSKSEDTIDKDNNGGKE